MFFVSKAASFVAERAIPAVAGAALNNPISATVLTAGAAGLAAWKGAEVMVKGAPLARSLKEKMHSWTAPDAVKQAAQRAADDVHAAATAAELKAAAEAAVKAAEKAIAAAEEAKARATQAAQDAPIHADVAFMEGAPVGRVRVNGGQAA